MAGFRLENTLTDHGSVARGVCRVSESGMLERGEELTKIEKTDEGAVNSGAEGHRELSGAEPVSMNFWAFRPSIFSHLKSQFVEFLEAHGQEEKSEFYIPSVVDRMIREGNAEVEVIATDSKWFGVTYKEDRPVVMSALKERVERGEYPSGLWE